MKFRWDLRRFGFVSLVLGASGAWCPAAEEAFIRSFDSPNGETYFSVSLTDDGSADTIVPHDHILLVDTSASQVGDYRRQTLAVAESLLRSLPADDRVSVLAVDLAATDLTSGLLSPTAAADEALPALRQRFPAGATDLLLALRTAVARIPGERPASIIYLGDGMSTAHLLDSAELQSVLDELRGRRIPVHAMAIGPNKDIRLLGTLASQTGGKMLIDDWRDDQQRPAAEAGTELAQAVDQPVWYPSEIKTDADLLPAAPLPIRPDQATVFIGRGEIAGKQIELTGHDGVRKTWALAAPQSANGNTFLYTLWGRADSSPAVGAGLAGETVMAFAQTQFEDQVAALETAGYEALRNKDTNRAEAIGLAIRQVDPENVRAVGLINSAIESAPQVALLDDAAAPPPDDAAPAAAPAGAPVEAQAAPAPEAQADPLAEREAPLTDQGLIELARARQEARAQKLAGELDQTKAAANQVLRVDPGQALDMLERMRNQIKAALDISPEARERMLRELHSFTQFVRAEAAQREQELQALQLRDRIDEAQEQLIEKTYLADQRMEQLVDRVRALMIDFSAGDDEAAEEAEMVGRLIVNLRPGNPLGMAAVTLTEAAGQLRKASRLRALRADRYLETLYQVELSHVPFPDEPPVRYPPAEVWQALTERRKKWNSVDLKQYNPNEQRIYDALEKKVDLEFIDTEISQVIDFLAERFQIPILPDEAKLTEFGVGLDTPINLVISGVSLKSALKLILEQHELTYIIEDEVMKITTSEYANQLLQTRVYPVADLVIPIQPLFGGMGGFAGGQQLGGMGGQQGGLQGGGGGVGINLNVGGGGGFGSVPVEERGARAPAKFDNNAINALKKKR